MGYKHIKWHDEWIRENLDNYSSYKALTEAYNNEFNENVRIGSIKNHARVKLGLKKVRQSHRHYTEEQIEFLKEVYPKYGCRKAMEMFNERFNECRTFQSMKNFGVQHGLTVDEAVAIKNRLSGAHKPGSKRELKPVGSTRMECGRLVMKTEHGWVSATRATYEQEHGKIPKGYAVTALNGDCNDIDPDNLVAVPWSYLGLLQKYELRSEDREITRTGVMLCELYELLKKEESNGYLKKRNYI